MVVAGVSMVFVVVVLEIVIEVVDDADVIVLEVSALGSGCA